LNNVSAVHCQRVHCDKTEERSLHIFIPNERSLAYFSVKDGLVEATPYTWNFGTTGPCWNKIADFQPIFARSDSAV